VIWVILMPYTFIITTFHSKVNFFTDFQK